MNFQVSYLICHEINVFKGRILLFKIIETFKWDQCQLASCMIGFEGSSLKSFIAIVLLALVKKLFKWDFWKQYWNSSFCAIAYRCDQTYGCKIVCVLSGPYISIIVISSITITGEKSNFVILSYVCLSLKLQVLFKSRCIYRVSSFFKEFIIAPSC